MSGAGFITCESSIAFMYRENGERVDFAEPLRCALPQGHRELHEAKVWEGEPGEGTMLWTDVAAIRGGFSVGKVES